MELIARLIYIITIIFAAFFMWLCALSLLNGQSAMKPFLYAFGVLIIGVIISDYIESIKFKKK